MTPVSIGAIAGGLLSGVIPVSRCGVGLRHAPVTCCRVWGSRTRMVAAGAKSIRQGGCTAETSRAMQNAQSADYLSTPSAAIPVNLANPFTSTSWNETGGNSSASS